MATISHPQGAAEGLGAVACGHPETAAAAVELLRDGGNAFDAALAAFCAACVAEPVLCSLGGGGFLLARPASGEAFVYDFFVDTPRRPRQVGDLNFFAIEADFGTATQEFHIGLGAVATPGAIGGLFAVHEDLASLPMSRIVAPAVRLARAGVEVRPIDAFICRVVAPVLTAFPDSRALYGAARGAVRRDPAEPHAGLPQAGDRLRQPDLAESLERLAAESAALFYDGPMGERLVDLCRQAGGQLGPEDLAGYRVIKRPPLRQDYRQGHLLTNPLPSSGGSLIAFALGLLDGHSPAGPPQHDAEAAVWLARVMAATNEARLEHAVPEDDEAATLARLLEPDVLARYRSALQGRGRALRGTTHISVADRQGNLAALSLSNGEGCGILLPGTGIMLNNMLGEEDLSPNGFHRWQPGQRMTSMMAPSIFEDADGRLAALGSGGSNRLRTAILQVLLNLVDQRQSIEAAVEQPRLHVERGEAHAEAGFDASSLEALETATGRLRLWPAQNLFFGGVHGVVRMPDGRLAGAGDPRRGGVALLA